MYVYNVCYKHCTEIVTCDKDIPTPFAVPNTSAEKGHTSLMKTHSLFPLCITCSLFALPEYFHMCLLQCITRKLSHVPPVIVFIMPSKPQSLDWDKSIKGNWVLKCGPTVCHLIWNKNFWKGLQQSLILFILILLCASCPLSPFTISSSPSLLLPSLPV